MRGLHLRAERRGKKCGVCVKKCPKGCIDLDEAGRDGRARGRQHRPGHRLRRSTTPRASNATATGAAQRAHLARVRAADQRLRSHGRQDRHEDAEAQQTQEGRRVGVRRREGCRADSVAIIHCVGSRDTNHNPYCSRVCCMYSLKFAHLVREKLPEATLLRVLHRHARLRQRLRGVLPSASGRRARSWCEGARPRSSGRTARCSSRARTSSATGWWTFPVDMVILAVGLRSGARVGQAGAHARHLQRQRRLVQ